MPRVYPLICWWTLGSFHLWLLWIMLLWTVVYKYRSPCFQLFGGVYTYNWTCWIIWWFYVKPFEDLPSCLPQWKTFCILLAMHKHFNFSTSLPTLISVCSLIIAILTGVMMVLICTDSWLPALTNNILLPQPSPSQEKPLSPTQRLRPHFRIKKKAWKREPFSCGISL